MKHPSCLNFQNHITPFTYVTAPIFDTLVPRLFSTKKFWSGNWVRQRVSFSEVTIGPPLFTLATVSSAYVIRPLNFLDGVMVMAPSLISSFGIETTSKAFKKANESLEGVKVITRVPEVTFSKNSFITKPTFRLKLLIRTWF